MAIRVLIVDDSAFICHRLKQILEEHHLFQVVGIAGNGEQAVQMTAEYKPDVITMDVEMPVMDGISAVRQIMQQRPTPILMFSAATQVGAQATLDALNAGAVDFLPKSLNDIDDNHEAAKLKIRQRLKLVAVQSKTLNTRRFSANKNTTVVNPGNPDLILIAASTGGPVAIQKILKEIPENISAPVLIMQHMPKNFTESFAQRLNQLCKIKVKQAQAGDTLKAGQALLCPGGMQMEIGRKLNQYVVNIREKQESELFSPCVDISFASVAREFNGKVLAVVLTGMGSDGREGARQLKQQGATIWAQDKDSSTIYGMPRAIVEANLADEIVSLDTLSKQFKMLS